MDSGKGFMVSALYWPEVTVEKYNMLCLANK